MPKSKKPKARNDDFFHEDNRTDMETFQKSDGSKIKKFFLFLIAFCAMLAIVAWAGFFFFSPNKNTNISEEILFKIDCPKNIKSGEVITCNINYTNNSNVPLGSASVNLKVPKTFILSDSKPANNNLNWPLGALAGKKTGSIMIKGVFLDAVGASETMTAKLTYKPGNFNADFENVAEQTIKIDASVISIKIVAPQNIAIGEPATIKIQYQNASANTFKELQILADYPANFTVAKSTPNSDDSLNNRWTIPELASKANSEIIVSGFFVGNTMGPAEFKTQIGFLDEAQNFQTQEEVVTSTNVSANGIIVSMLINDKSQTEAVAFPGEKMNIKLNYQNAGKSRINNVVIIAAFPPEGPDVEIVNWTNTNDISKGLVGNRTITWTKKEIRNLSYLDPGETGSINFVLPILKNPQPAKENINYKVNATASIIGTDPKNAEQKFTSSPTAIILLSDTAIDGKVEQISGPIPTVSKSTTYKVTFVISNSLHDVTNLEFAAKLSPGIAYANRNAADAGEINFDDKTNKINWSLNWMPTSIKKINLNFDVVLTPAKNQKDTVVNLLESGLLTATDKLTGKIFTVTSGAIASTEKVR